MSFTCAEQWLFQTCPKITVTENNGTWGRFGLASSYRSACDQDLPSYVSSILQASSQLKEQGPQYDYEGLSLACNIPTVSVYHCPYDNVIVCLTFDRFLCVVLVAMFICASKFATPQSIQIIS